MSITPISEVLISMDKPLQDEIVFEGGLSIFKDPSWNPEWNASVTGLVAALPRKKAVQLNLLAGDEIAFGYDVVSDKNYGSDAHCFAPEIETPFFQKYRNGNGEILQIVAIPTAIAHTWVGSYLDKYGEQIDGFQGNEGTMGRWKSQFAFGSEDKFIFKNLLEYKGKDYWRCDLDNIFAKKVDGKIVAIGDRLILEPLVINLKSKKEIMDGKPLPFQQLTFTPSDRGMLIHDCEQLGLKKEDVVGFDERFVERYNLWGKDYFLIKKHRAFCKWSVTDN